MPIPFSNTWERISSETDLKNFTQLAKFLGSTQPNVSRKKKEDKFPAEWILKICINYRLMPEWLISGTGPKRITDIEKKAELEFPILEELNDWLKEVTFNDPARKDWFRVQVEDFFPKFKNWLKRKEKKDSESKNFPDSKVA